MVIYKKVCGICGSKFNGGAPNAKYCSEACKKEAKRRSQRKFWKKQNKPWFQQDVGYNSGDPSDAQVPDSKDPSGRKPSKVTRETKPFNPDSKDPQGSGDIPAGSSEGPGDDIVNPDSKDLLEPGDLTLFNIPPQGAIKDPLESGDLPAGSQDLQGSGDLPAGSSGDLGDDRVPDSKDLSGRELSKVTRETKPSNPDSKDPQGSGDIPAGGKQSFLDDFFEWLGW